MIVQMRTGIAAVCLMLMSVSALAQGNYPNRPVRLLVPYPPGGSTTTVTHLVGQKLGANLGQQVLIDNRPGGNTVIGTQALVRSLADGYTILLITSSHVINPLVMHDLPYDSIRDFAAIGTLVNTYYTLTVHPSVPANTLREFIALAKAKPGALNYGSVGSGGTIHLAAELFNSVAGVKTQQVPYKGTGPSVTDLVGGRIQFIINNTLNLAPMVKTGKIRALAVSGNTRSSALPDVPTFAEAGLPGYNAGNWFGLLAPAATPRDIVLRLSSELTRVMSLAEVREQLNNEGLDPFISTPEQFAAFMKSELAKFAKLVESANIKLEN